MGNPLEDTGLLREGQAVDLFNPKYLQELLGHASIAQTLDTYSHVLPGMDGGIGDTIDEVLA
jgi:integrase